MKGKKKILIGIILGALLGWAAGYLRMPFIDKNFSLLVGFITCLSIISLVIFLLFIWNKHGLLLKLLGKDPTEKDSGIATKTYTLIWVLVAVFIVLGGLLSSFLIFKQNELLRINAQDQNKKIEQQSELIESIRKSNLVFLMGNVLDKVDDELKNNPTAKLSDATIARIAAMGYSFKPYRYLEGDSLSEQKFSPERGQLLLALSNMNIDSSSFNKVKLKTPFSDSDLKKAILKGADLSNANLKGAILIEADLRKAILKGADLRGAKFWGAKLREADLREADLKRVNFSWADMNGADLSRASMNGANMTSTKLKNGNLSEVSLRWADLSGISLNETNLAGVDLVGSNLTRANLSQANLNDADLRYIDLSEADLTGVKIKGAAVEKDWFDKLSKWNAIGIKGIQAKYKIVKDASSKSNHRIALIEE